MSTIKPKDHVRISTGYYGCYHDKTGVIKTMATNDAKLAENAGFEYSATCPGWFRVRFDTPADNGGTPVYEELFMPRELTVI